MKNNDILESNNLFPKELQVDVDNNMLIFDSEEHYEFILKEMGSLSYNDWDLWEKSGGTDVFKTAEKQVLDFLNQDLEPLLPEQVEAKIDEVVQKRVT